MSDITITLCNPQTGQSESIPGVANTMTIFEVIEFSKALLGMSGNLVIAKDGEPLASTSQSLLQAGVVNGDLLVVTSAVAQSPAPAPAQAPSAASGGLVLEMNEEAAKRELYTFILVFQNWAKNLRDDRDCVVPPTFVEGLKQYIVEPFPVLPGLDQEMVDFVKKACAMQGRKIEKTVEGHFEYWDFTKYEKIQPWRDLCYMLHDDDSEYDEDNMLNDDDSEYNEDDDSGGEDERTEINLDDEEVIKKSYEFYLRQFTDAWAQLCWQFKSDAGTYVYLGCKSDIVTRFQSDADNTDMCLCAGASNMIGYYNRLYILNNWSFNDLKKTEVLTARSADEQSPEK